MMQGGDTHHVTGKKIFDLGRRCDISGRIPPKQQTRSSRKTLDGESRAKYQQITILYFVRAAAAFKQYAHGLWPGPRWLGHARQMGTAAGLGR